MKFIWEPEDFKSENNWGGLATRGDEEIVIIGGRGVTSLRDGHHWDYATFEEMAACFNEHKYIPVLAPVNASVVLKKLHEKKFNYGVLP
jgi:hypothetical protein